MNPLNFELSADVQLSKSGEIGTVKRRAEYLHFGEQLLANLPFRRWPAS
jgi:hypothetical protein